MTGNREFAKINELQEVYTVLAERVTQWTKNWHEQGRQAKRDAKRDVKKAFKSSDRHV